MLTELFFYGFFLRFALAALCGIRASLPFFVLSALSLFMGYDISPESNFFHSWWVFGAASVYLLLETLSSLHPRVEHLLHLSAPYVAFVGASSIQLGAFGSKPELLQLFVSVFTAGLAAVFIHVLWTRTMHRNPTLFKDVVASVLCAAFAFVCTSFPYLSTLMLGLFVLVMLLRLNAADE